MNAPDDIAEIDINAVPQVELLTREGGSLPVPTEFRSMAALYADGSFYVSESHQTNPLIIKVPTDARRLKPGVIAKKPRLVGPEFIQELYITAQRQKSATAIGGEDNQSRTYINDILIAGRRMMAADIHIEVEGAKTTIDLGVDNGLLRVMSLTRQEGDRLVSAVFQFADEQSGSQLSRHEPSSAMIVPKATPGGIIFPEGISQARAEWVPTAEGGVYLVLRLHYTADKILGTDVRRHDVRDLGYTEAQAVILRSLRNQPFGLTVMAGPVNHGKTTTLRWLINKRMAETRYKLNCLLIEDPPEGGVPRARQLFFGTQQGDDDKREKNFLKLMRSALRLSPNLIMLGEIRDRESAAFALRMALTGRQCLSSLHVYDALSIPKRLHDLGVDPTLIYDHKLLRGLLAQRLVRRLCPACKVPLLDAMMTSGDAALVSLVARTRIALTIRARELTDIGRGNEAQPLSKDRMASLDHVFVANPKGCQACGGEDIDKLKIGDASLERFDADGRRGRIVVAETIETNAQLMSLLSKPETVPDARAYWLSKDGLSGETMMHHGLRHIQAGIVSPDDVEAELGPLCTEREIQQADLP
jgi:type II secretory ATPase GspE/PulE/Tfp pilus assembly ATPase PilB-like protein